MKKIKNGLSFLFLAAAVGCVTSPQVIVNQPVGPDLAPPRVNLNKGQGRLVVYTATEVTDPANAYFPTHSAYVIHTPDGRLVRRVDNRTGSFYQSPNPVLLPPGAYLVKGRATNAGEVSVTVIIKENKTTVVHLEGANLPQHKPTGAGQWIRLPDGQVIGMRFE